MDVTRPPKTFPIVVTWSRGQSLEEVSVLSLGTSHWEIPNRSRDEEPGFLPADALHVTLFPLESASAG